jgi:hypothetical protein
MDVRSYSEWFPDVHDRMRSISLRERLIRANGNANNHVIMTTSGTGSIFTEFAGGSPFNNLITEGALELERWLDAIAADTRPGTQAEKVARNRPKDVVDACYTPSGQRVEEPVTLTGTGQCAQLYPIHRDPRLISGAPVTNDVIKCALKPLVAQDYPQGLSAGQLARLQAVFPNGVCDYSQPGIAQTGLLSTWLSYSQPGNPTPLAGGGGAAVR